MLSWSNWRSASRCRISAAFSSKNCCGMPLGLEAALMSRVHSSLQNTLEFLPRKPVRFICNRRGSTSFFSSSCPKAYPINTSSSTPPSNSVNRVAIQPRIASQFTRVKSTLVLYSMGNVFANVLSSFFSLLPNRASCSADTPLKALPDIFG